MQKYNKNVHLDHCENKQNDYSVELKNPPHLLLVWNRGNTLAKNDRSGAKSSANNPNREQVTVLPSPSPPSLRWYRRWWQSLRANADPIQSLSIIVGGIISVITAVCVVAWAVFSVNNRLGQLEEKINGTGGLVDVGERITRLEKKVDEKLGAVDERLTRIEAQFQFFEKYVVPQVFKSKAETLLGTPAVGIFHVVNNRITTDAQFTASYGASSQVPPSLKNLSVTYTFEEARNGVFRIRGKLEEQENGKVVRTLAEGHIESDAPSKVGKPDTYCFSFAKDNSMLPVVCVEVVLLEEVSPNNLVFASAVKAGITS